MTLQGKFIERYVKIPNIDTELLNEHKIRLIHKLDFEYGPVVLYGDEAFSFLKSHVKDYNELTNKEIFKKFGGYFLYEDLPEEYRKTGVVCIFNGEVGTLAHELRHAKQFQDRSKWLIRGIWLKRYYKWAYSFYPSEVQAYLFAANYLFKSKCFILGFKYSLKAIMIFSFGSIITWPFYMFYLTMWLVHLNLLSTL